jgi:membrane fusion protein (multidrug efflux system)
VTGRNLPVWRAFLVVSLFALLLPTGCSRDSTAGRDGDSTSAAVDTTATGEQEDGEAAQSSREKKTRVNVAPVIQGDLVVAVVAEGEVRARRAGDVRTETAGRIERISVREGQRVRRGQLLAKLDDREARVALVEARSSYLESLGRIAADRDTLDGSSVTDQFQEKMAELERLEEEGTITHQERLDRQVALEVEAVRQGAYRGELVKARSGLSAARAAVERAELELEHTEILAPYAGVISGLTLTVGEQVTRDAFFCRLVDLKNLEASVDVLESDLDGLETGRPAFLAIPALEETLRVQVDVLSPEIDSQSRTCQVLLRFENPEGTIRPGMFVRASIAARVYPDRILVPREAVLTREGRPLVFKVVDGRAEWVYVKLGLSNDRVMEIARVLQGGPLEPGSQVIVSDHLTLSHQAPIRVGKVVEPVLPFADDGGD